MRDLIVVGFEGIHRASEVLGQLRRLHDDWTIQLDDAVAVYRDSKGKLRIEQSVDPTSREGAAWGGLWGGLIGAVIAAPFTAGASAAAAATALAAGALGAGAFGAAVGATDAAWWKEDFGISEDFVDQVGGMVKVGNSAIFALLTTGDPKTVAENFRGYGGTVLRTTLSPEQAKKIQDVLDSNTVVAGARR
jgi:uncharacterized membrane protein